MYLKAKTPYNKPNNVSCKYVLLLFQPFLKVIWTTRTLNSGIGSRLDKRFERVSLLALQMLTNAQFVIRTEFSNKLFIRLNTNRTKHMPLTIHTN